MLSFSVGQTIKFNSIKKAGCFIANLNTNKNLRTFLSWYQGRIIFFLKLNPMSIYLSQKLLSLVFSVDLNISKLFCLNILINPEGKSALDITFER